MFATTVFGALIEESFAFAEIMSGYFMNQLTMTINIITRNINEVPHLTIKCGLLEIISSISFPCSEKVFFNSTERFANGCGTLLLCGI